MDWLGLLKFTPFGFVVWLVLRVWRGVDVIGWLTLSDSATYRVGFIFGVILETLFYSFIFQWLWNQYKERKMLEKEVERK